MKLTKEEPKIVDLRMDMDTVIITFKQEDKTITLSFKSELIKQWKEDAEKYRRITDYERVNNPRLFASSAVEDAQKNQKIVERLKKRIEELKQIDDDDVNDERDKRIDELQKIREDNLT